jgi:hypothetical protein
MWCCPVVWSPEARCEGVIAKGLHLVPGPGASLAHTPRPNQSEQAHIRLVEQAEHSFHLPFAAYKRRGLDEQVVRYLLPLVRLSWYNEELRLRNGKSIIHLSCSYSRNGLPSRLALAVV